MTDKKTDYLKGFETDRLIIRKLTRRDMPVWAEYFLDKESFPYIGLEDNKLPCDHSEEWIDRQFKRYENNEYGLLALVEKDSMNLVGQCGIILMNVESDGELEIGYHIISKFRGRGFATEACAAFRDYVFENDIADSVITVINNANTLSMNVSEKLGFTREKETICMNQPSYMYRITREEWEKLQT
jgi:ribosomal-protein-alanine N-acetyltransferase